MIERIWLRNFRRYVDEKVDLTKGVNFIDGPNNAGKSTVLYAIEYALFGRVGAIKQIHTLMHPGSKEVGVELRFVGVDGARYRLQRMHEKPPRSRTNVVGHFTLKRLNDDGEVYVLSTDFQDKEEQLALKLQEILGLSRRLFDVAVHVKQGEIASMLEGAPELDTVLGVTASVLAADEMRAMALEREKEAGSLSVLEATLLGLRDDIVDGEARAQKAEAEVASVRAEEEALQERRAHNAAALAAVDAFGDAVDAFEGALDDVRSLKSEVDRLTAAVTTLGNVDVLAAEQESLEAGQGAQREELSRLDDERSRLERHQGDLLGRIARREAQGTAPSCESCGQAVDVAAALAGLKAWQDEAAASEAKIAATRVAQATTSEALAVAEVRRKEIVASRSTWEALASAQSALAVPMAAVAKAEVNLRQGAAALGGEGADVVEAGADLADVVGETLHKRLEGWLEERRVILQSERVRTETILEGLSARRSRAEELLAELRERGKGAARECARVEAEVERLQEKKALAVRLRKLAAAFKELQVTLRDQAAAELSVEVLNLHQQLSAPEQEYKTLSIDPARYVVNVTPHDIGSEVPAHLFQGGGHKLLLGLAFKLAVARRVGACPFILLDEPTYGLDEQRRASLLGRIAGLEASKQMILITHHDVGDVDGHHIRILKKGKKSTQQVEKVSAP